MARGARAGREAAPGGRLRPERPEDYRFDLLVDDVVAITERLGWTTFDLVGHDDEDQRTRSRYMLDRRETPATENEMLAHDAEKLRAFYAGKVPQTGNQGKMYVSAVLLPDGKVLETGGGLNNRANPVFESSLYDPATNTFDPVAADPEARGYHSSAFLLPDGRVMATGDNPGNGSWNHNVSIYTPPYLLKGARPAITSVID